MCSMVPFSLFLKLVQREHRLRGQGQFGFGTNREARSDWSKTQPFYSSRPSPPTAPTKLTHTYLGMFAPIYLGRYYCNILSRIIKLITVVQYLQMIDDTVDDKT